MSILLETNLPLPLLHRGKVRDNYELGDRLLIVASDRISAFDVVLPCGIPDKGAVLNLISAFWFAKTAHIVPNHLLEVVRDTAQLKAYAPQKNGYPAGLANRSMIVRKAKRISIECVVRGYLSGSAWAEYSSKGTVNELGDATRHERIGAVPGGHLHALPPRPRAGTISRCPSKAWRSWWDRS